MFRYPMALLTGDSFSSCFETLVFFGFFSSGKRSTEVFSFSSLLLLSCFLLTLKLISIWEFLTFLSRLYWTTARLGYFSSLILSVFFLSTLFYKKINFSGSYVTNRCFLYLFKTTGDMGSKEISFSPSSDN